MTKPRTICAECIHSNMRGPIWYDQYCQEPSQRRAKVIDPHTGLDTYANYGQEYPYVRDVNTDGECPLYKRSGARTAALKVRRAINPLDEMARSGRG